MVLLLIVIVCVFQEKNLMQYSKNGVHHSDKVFWHIIVF